MVRIIEWINKKQEKFWIKIPTKKELATQDVIEINGKTLIGEDVTNDLPIKVNEVGEKVYHSEDYDLYFYEGRFYEYYWGCASGLIISKIEEVGGF